MYVLPADYYDLLYSEKDYEREAHLLRDIITVRRPGAQLVLDLWHGEPRRAPEPLLRSRWSGLTRWLYCQVALAQSARSLRGRRYAGLSPRSPLRCHYLSV